MDERPGLVLPHAPAANALVAAPTRRDAGLVSVMPVSARFRRMMSSLGVAIGMGFFIPAPARFIVMAVCLGGLAMIVSFPAIRRFKTRRTLARVPRGLPPAAPRGERVHVVGTVHNAATSLPFAPALGGGSAVVARYIGLAGPREQFGQRLRWELHATDFLLEVDDGRATTLLVEAQHLRVMPDPPKLERGLLRQEPILLGGATGRAPVWLYRQETVQPGDRIEVVGTIDHVPTPAGVGSDRQPRLAPVLRGTPDAPVTITLTTPAPRTIVPIPWR